MALKQVTPGTYDYGAYARPQQVKLADKSGIAAGIMSAAQSVKGAIERQAEYNETEAKKKKEKELKQGTVQGEREAILSNYEATAGVLKTMAEAQTELDFANERGELDPKEYSRLKTRENLNYQDTIGFLKVAEQSEVIDLNEDFKSDADFIAASRNNALALGSYKVTDYNPETGANIEIKYLDKNGNTITESFTTAEASKYFSSKEAKPRFKFNYTRDLGEAIKTIGNRYNQTYGAKFAVQKGKDMVLNEGAAIAEMSKDKDIMDIAAVAGKNIWEDVLGNPEGSFKGTPEQIEQVTKSIAQESIQRYGKKYFGAAPVEEAPTEPKPTASEITTAKLNEFSDMFDSDPIGVFTSALGSSIKRDETGEPMISYNSKTKMYDVIDIDDETQSYTKQELFKRAYDESKSTIDVVLKDYRERKAFVSALEEANNAKAENNDFLD